MATGRVSSADSGGGGGTAAPAPVGRRVSILRRAAGGGGAGVRSGEVHDAVRFGNAGASPGIPGAPGIREVALPEGPWGGGGRLEARPSKNGSSSAIVPSA